MLYFKGASYEQCVYANNNHQSNFTAGNEINIEFKKEKISFTSKTNIYIRGLDENTTDNDLQEMCQK